MTSSWQTQPPQELLHHFTSVQDQIQQYGFRLKSDKCTFFQMSVKYLGFIFDKKSQRPDPENIHSIKNMSAPTDVSTLRSFLRLLSHYDSFFLPELRKLRGPLKKLFLNYTLNGTDQAHAKNHLRRSNLSSVLLTHYDPSVDITVVSHASD